MFVGIVSIFADCTVVKDKDTPENKFIQPFPPGTQKVPYVREDTNMTSEETGRESNMENTRNNDLNIKSDIIEVKESHSTTEEYNQDDMKVKSNPYDLPEDF